MAFGDDYVTVAEASRRTGYSVRHIQKLLKAGRIEGIKPGHDWFVRLASLREHQRTVRIGRPPKRADW